MLQICNFKNQLKLSKNNFHSKYTSHVRFNMLCFIKPCLCASHDWLDDPLSHMRCLKENPKSASRNCSHSTQCTDVGRAFLTIFPKNSIKCFNRPKSIRFYVVKVQNNSPKIVTFSAWNVSDQLLTLKMHLIITKGFF